MIYTPDDYNQYDVLNVPMSFTLATIYMLKHFIIFTLPMVAQTMPAVVKFAHAHVSVTLMIVSIPAILVLFASLRRTPYAGKIPRWLWKNAKILLFSSVFLEISIIVSFALLNIKQFDAASLLFLYIDSIIVLYLWRSKRLKDVLAEFPVPEREKLAKTINDRLM